MFHRQDDKMEGEDKHEEDDDKDGDDAEGAEEEEEQDEDSKIEKKAEKAGNPETEQLHCWVVRTPVLLDKDRGVDPRCVQPA